MKTFKTILAAAFIAGSATVAMAQGSGGGAGSDVNPDRINKGADQNPTGAGHEPAVRPHRRGYQGFGEDWNLFGRHADRAGLRHPKGQQHAVAGSGD